MAKENLLLVHMKDQTLGPIDTLRDNLKLIMIVSSYTFSSSFFLSQFPRKFF